MLSLLARRATSSSTNLPAFAARASSTAAVTLENMNQNLRHMEYAVRGPIVIKADEISAKGGKVLYTNIGNPQSVGQKPLTWPRQVMALVDLPAEVGVDHPAATTLFPADAIDRARVMKAALGGGTGSYSHSKGVKLFRDDVCEFISNRDGGLPTDPESIFLTNGASTGINHILQTVIASPKSGCMIPIPQYPIYSATLAVLNGRPVPYNLDEQKGWSCTMEQLEESLAKAKAEGVDVRAFVLINPGNPTGQVLTKEAIEDVTKFCAKHNLVLLADEVYQENIYTDDKKFVSCKRAAADAGVLDKITMASFHSTSKGIFGECGRRGGYMELTGFSPEIADEIYKLASSSLCSNLPGQVMTSLMCKGPKPGEASYDSHELEKKTIFDSLKKRAQIVVTGLNAIDGFSCQPAEGSMYCFPKIEIPDKAVAEAKAKGMSPDGLYALSLLESTGICVVPASGFGQEEGRYGFRTTFLPNEEEMAKGVADMKKHHEEFVKRYS
jgi:aspartate/methionine/tyrosine aminotransferase